MLVSAWCPQRPEEGVRSPRTGVIDSRELLVVWVLRIKPGCTGGAAGALTGRAISPAPGSHSALQEVKWAAGGTLGGSEASADSALGAAGDAVLGFSLNTVFPAVDLLVKVGEVVDKLFDLDEKLMLEWIRNGAARLPDQSQEDSEEQPVFSIVPCILEAAKQVR